MKLKVCPYNEMFDSDSDHILQISQYEAINKVIVYVICCAKGKNTTQ